MQVHLVNPSDISFGIGVITPRWLYVLAAATGDQYGDPKITDETLEPFDPESIQPGDVVGIGIHTGNALRGIWSVSGARARGLGRLWRHPRHALSRGSARARRRARGGQRRWRRDLENVLADCANGGPQHIYDGGRIAAERFLPARWDLLPPKLHVGVGADRARVSQALLVLLGVADRWPGAPAAREPIR